MPEGPEVKKTTDGLREFFLNEEITALDFGSGRYTKKEPIGYSSFRKELPKLVTAVGCKGKFIYFVFADGSSMWNTLGMTGWWSETAGYHPRAALYVNDDKHMVYNDMRNFGTFKFVSTYDELKKKLNSLGPDLLSEDVSLDAFKKSLTKGKRAEKPISQLLMDQSVVSGIGNYLKAEILYSCKISPHRLCRDISDDEFESLLYASRSIMKLSYSTGGATIRNYKDTTGKNGMYTRRFAVYNQKSDLLGNEVVKERTADKRTTHWVPSIQK